MLFQPNTFKHLCYSEHLHSPFINTYMNSPSNVITKIETTRVFFSNSASVGVCVAADYRQKKCYIHIQPISPFN